MRLSGFSMCRNADTLYYPFLESIKSVLPLVDEFVVAVGASDEPDRTLEKIHELNDPKIRVVEAKWDLKKFPQGSVHAQQTDLAKSYCTGDWLIYLQADEVLHERDLEEIKSACKEDLGNKKIEGFVLDYLHFWGDYDHIQDSHTWYPREVRIIRNDPNIHSWMSAQSFRHYDDFNSSGYLHKRGTRKLKVKQLNARVFHYGWVRPPEIMTAKANELDAIHCHKSPRLNAPFHYGDLSMLTKFKGQHPSVMEQRVKEMNWSPTEGQPAKFMRHDQPKARAMTWIEKHILGGKKVFTNHNYDLVR